MTEGFWAATGKTLFRNHPCGVLLGLRSLPERAGRGVVRAGQIVFKTGGAIEMASERVHRGWRLGIALCAIGSISLLGCGGNHYTPVVGSVTLDGQPLDGVRVVFSPDAAKGNTATINCDGPAKDGHYELRTNAVTRSESGSGVPPGWYKVTIFAPETGGRKQPGPKHNIPQRYLHVTKTPLEIEVKDNPEPGAYDLKLTK